MEISQAIDRLDGVTAGSALLGCWYLMFSAKNQLGSLFYQSVYTSHLRVSRQKASELETALNEVSGDGNDMTRLITEFEAWSVKNARDQFRTVLMSELSTLPAFLVSTKESYDLNTLIDDGLRLFPPTLIGKVPEARHDVIEAGRALAFELSTACGFHTFRVIESVLKRYWDEVSTLPRPKLETMGSFAVELEKGKHGDQKIWETLKQIAKLHRNPLIHPEVILEVEEAIEILGMARSAIGAMLRRIPDLPVTTSTMTSPQTQT
jgi:hypothetical protein